ncbi:hypothetical protein EDD21DRAFT_131854 [Dissophora ornata]|nr:hypothetical protein BGZ58_000290 [Dissophora ornata]KAI8600497.1 hypothetical protein EDD21DRAFT_131854 [Dissophora ornata]
MLSDTSESQTSSGLTLDRCTQHQAFDIFYTWSIQEHWNPGSKGEDILDVFYKIDPQGFFYGKILNKETLREEIVSIVSGVRYGEDQAWVGFYIVSPNHRGHGYGIASFHKALEHVGHNRLSVGLDGVMAQVENYKKSGFTSIAWQNERRNGSARELVEVQERELADQILKGTVPGLVHLSDAQVDLEQLPLIEQKYSGLKRPQFVKDWALFHTHHPEQHRFGVAVLGEEGQKNGKPVVLGYACVRPAESSYRVGPLYASTPEVAKQLLVKLAFEVVQAEKQKPYNIPLQFDVDIPNSNKEAAKLFDGLGWNDTFPSMRMWKGKVPEHDVNGVYAVSTLEVG